MKIKHAIILIAIEFCFEFLGGWKRIMRWRNSSEGLLTVDQEKRLEVVLRHYDTADIILVTVDTTAFTPGPLEKFTLDLLSCC